MKRFRFNLQQVLDLKANQKQHVAQNLAVAERAKNRIESTIERLTESWKREKEALDGSMKKMVAAEYQMRVRYLDHLDLQIERERNNLFEASSKVADVRRKLIQFSQEEQALNILKDKKYQHFQKELGKREQADLDELVSQRSIVKSIARRAF